MTTELFTLEPTKDQRLTVVSIFRISNVIKMAGVGSGGGTKTQCREPRKALFQSPDQEDSSKAPGY